MDLSANLAESVEWDYPLLQRLFMNWQMGQMRELRSHFGLGASLAILMSPM